MPMCLHQNRWTVSASIRQQTQTIKMYAETIRCDVLIPIQIDLQLALCCGPRTILLVAYNVLYFSQFFEFFQSLMVAVISFGFQGETNVKMKGCFLDNSCTNTECIDTSQTKKMNFCCCTGHMCNSKYKLIPTTTKPPTLEENSTY